MTFHTGHIPDHPEVVKKRTGIHLHPKFASWMAGVASLPMQTTNRAKLMPQFGGPGVLNQNDTGSCEGHGHAAGGTLLLANQGKSQGLISPAMLYLGALLCDSTLQADGTLSTITDTGTMPSSIQSAWQTFGAILAVNDPQYPAISTTMYQTPSNPNSPLIIPGPDKLYAASPYRFQGMYFLATGGPAKTLALLVALAGGYPVSDAIPASGAQFQGYTGGVLGALSGDIDHCNLIMDYQWTGTSTQWTQYVTALTQNNISAMLPLNQYLLLICLNSWSTSWGEADAVSTATGGTYQANTDYLTQAESLCALEISLAA
jgi:hypothetical protein